ncbi:PTS system mannose/fructose/sorbose family transporter subunit IID [Lactobacillus sp. IBH004]|uniref:PTS system mannose/fructose/sorbose family transporter subunit IID n=1 Tax=Lactobacillus sp. IBH004 TaxID=2879107 RepID=UPI002244E890|nr:PTS system mannose/fructose/sorbose family transporter subunit IID [Lactobacillus sp. IBH004]MCT6847458.1 PTS system mannose/fructose/sorbose family transporter subunit IID [Lactobacillus helsingborgensis]UZN41792.1 PTS system mannose/fructose/sorbose family transporter subunit IID [Lactobacillus sp. IBH004]
MTTISKENKITNKDLRQIMWRSLPMEFGWNYERQMHLAFAYMMAPLMKKLYHKNQKEYTESLERQMEFFNCTPQLVPFIGGIVASMEEKNSEDKDFDVSTISAIKTALMGPLSGIGDSLFLGTLRVLAVGVAASLSMKGSILGPILFLLIYNIPAYLVRYFGVKAGYNMGTSYLDKIQKSGLMDKFKEAAGILGVMVIGAMTQNMVVVKVVAKFGTGKTATSLQSVLDGILPGVLSLLVLYIFYVLNKKKINVLWQLLGATIIGVLLTVWGVLGV